jgi:hypothetical protein
MMSLILSGTDGVQDNSGAIVRDTAKVAVTDFTTSADFTGIPPWVKRITVIFSALSLSGTNNVIVRIGPSSGVVSSGYVAAATTVSTTTTNTTNGTEVTSGFVLGGYTSTASALLYGHVVITNMTGNTWVCSGVYHARNVDRVGNAAGAIILGDVLTQVSVTRTGTDTFDSGTINIIYE